jgi:glycine dehydrogenase
MHENYALEFLRKMLSPNKVMKSFIGKGYHNTITPSVVKRNVLENPKWYSPYTPYQAEISQGRLESLHNFQTLVKSLSGLPLTNASLLDEGSSAAEVMTMCYSYHRNKRKQFYASESLHPQTLKVLETRAYALDIDLKIDALDKFQLGKETSGFLFQYPDTNGEINIPFDMINESKENDVLSTCSNDLLSTCIFKSPGEIDVDIAFGTMQRFGVPMYFGGPHPAYLACKGKFLRYMPGRIIGESIDIKGNPCYRLGLQTREQHIKKERATSNICTSQALLANISSMYALHHGKEGIANIANKTHKITGMFYNWCVSANLEVLNRNYFDTVTFRHKQADLIQDELYNGNILVFRDNDIISVTFDECSTLEDKSLIISIISRILKKHGVLSQSVDNENSDYNYRGKEKSGDFDNVYRETEFLNEELYNGTDEVSLTRYIHRLADKDYSLVNGMIPLGSCTMKLNPSYTLEPLTWKTVANIHPFSPVETNFGYKSLIKHTGNYLKKLTGFSHYSFQPNSGAMGEYTGLLCIKKYHEVNNTGRNVCLIPKSAHGTNFASAALVNMKIVGFDDKEFENFSEFVGKYKDTLACLMITIPNTSGMYQDNIEEITKVIHSNGGLVYMDGANMNALVGKVKPGSIGADVCHLNLHKTFCIPHGGGGPGMGPILCNDKLGKFLPGNVFQDNDNDNSIGSVTSSQWSSASLLTIPFLYLHKNNNDVRINTELAIENSNYIKQRLKDHYTIDSNKSEHEFIIDLQEFKEFNITDVDIAKRLIDYSFHPPTMSWPKLNAIMIEPTESESKEELDRFIDAMISIRREIEEIKNGEYSENDNVLKNAPHIISDSLDWNYCYSREKAFFPMESLKKYKFWPSIKRVDDKFGDKKMYECY